MEDTQQVSCSSMAIDWLNVRSISNTSPSQWPKESRIVAWCRIILSAIVPDDNARNKWYQRALGRTRKGLHVLIVPFIPIFMPPFPPGHASPTSQGQWLRPIVLTFPQDNCSLHLCSQVPLPRLLFILFHQSQQHLLCLKGTVWSLLVLIHQKLR